MANENKYLIAGLGNVGAQYNGTRHNAGFRVVNALAPEGTDSFSDNRYGAIARMRVKNKELVLLKPSTFMNLSGNAVRYWVEKENIPLKNILIVVDELALPFGALRMKTKGSDGGHNGLKHIAQTLGTQAYARLRVGIGSEYSRGGQVDYVLSPFTADEEAALPEICKTAAEFIKTFCLAGPDVAMNRFNTKGHPDKKQEPQTEREAKA